MLGAAQPLEAGTVADEARVVPERSTKLRCRLGFRGRRLRRLDGSLLRLAERRQSGATAEDEALEQRVRGEPVGAVDAGTGDLAGGIETVYLRPPFEVCDHAAHRVVGRRRDGDRLLTGVVALLLYAGHQPREPGPLDRPQVEKRRPARVDGAGDDVAWCELIGEAFAVVVEQERARSAQRLAEEQARAEEPVGWNCMNSRSATAAPARYASTTPWPRAAARVGRPLPERSGSAGREQRRARGDDAPVGDDADAAAARRPQADDPLALGDADARMRAHPFGENARDLLPGRRAARVEDARERMAALPAGLVLEVDAQVDQVDDPRRRFLGQDAHGARPAEAAAGAQRVLRVQRRRVAGTRRGGDAALGEIARRREQRAF